MVYYIESFKNDNFTLNYNLYVDMICVNGMKCAHYKNNSKKIKNTAEYIYKVIIHLYILLLINIRTITRLILEFAAVWIIQYRGLL